MDARGSPTQTSAEQTLKVSIVLTVILSLIGVSSGPARGSQGITFRRDVQLRGADRGLAHCGEAAGDGIQSLLAVWSLASGRKLATAILAWWYQGHLCVTHRVTSRIRRAGDQSLAVHRK
jgi:hypothetical protein